MVKEDKLNDTLFLYLQFPFSDKDSVSNAWEQLKTDFENQNTISLEQELFYKMVSIMQLPQTMASIKLYNTYDTREIYCFKRKIFFEKEEVVTEEEKCKAKKREVHFDAIDFAKLRTGKTLEIDGETGNRKKLTPMEIREKFPKEYVFEEIFQYAKKRYEKVVCEERFPRVQILENKKVLRIEVTNLCKEVVTNSTLAKWLNLAKRERLIFTFSYVETLEGFSLHCVIDGAYGSGYYEEVRRGGYINMEVDFDMELEHYADLFKEEIRTLLRNK